MIEFIDRLRASLPPDWVLGYIELILIIAAMAFIFAITREPDEEET